MQGITEYRLKHMLGVARRCYEIALENGYDEHTARKLFLVGYLHDIGYEFSETGENHADISNQMIISLFGVENKAIKEHGQLNKDLNNIELRILNIADLTVDSFGNKCTVYNRLLDIKNRYGKESKAYQTALDLAKQLKLVADDFGNEKEGVQVNSKGVNTKIKANILSDTEMQKIGFTEYRKGYLHFSRLITFPKDKRYNGLEITFNVTIPKDNSDISIDVLDEAFCQPYDYQRMLEDNPEFKIALIVKEQVEEWMKYLADTGVITGHNYGEYI